MDQESFENNVQDWMNDGFASGWPTASGANGVACDFQAWRTAVLHATAHVQKLRPVCTKA